MKNIFILSFLLSFFSYSQDFNRVKYSESKKKEILSLSKKFEKDYIFSLKEAEKKHQSVLVDSLTNKKYYLQGSIDSNYPKYYANFNAGSAITSRTDKLHQGGGLGLDLNGLNQIVGLWEGDAARSSHLDLNGRVTQGDFSLFTSSNEQTSHATHVAGTMVSSGDNDENAKGMAPQANIIGYDWNNDLSEMTTEAANGLILSNHSYGTQLFDGTNLIIPLYLIGKYNNAARDLDQLLNTAEYYLPIIAAGNDRQLQGFATNKGGYDMLVGRRLSKNAITVGAVEEVPNYTSPFSVNMSSFSNWGPSDDGRIKPDICTKGVDVYSLNSTSDTAYLTNNGTSMATPGTTGTLLLLQEHYNNLNSLNMKAATIKGLITHTADEAGFSDGPDYQFGWGLLNAERAANCITNDGTTALILEDELFDGQTYQIKLTPNNNEPLIATLSWSDPEGNVYNASSEEMLDYDLPVLVHDLDLRLIDATNTINYPWTLNKDIPQVGAIKADNTLDNIEKVEINVPVSEYDLTISHKNALNNGKQNFSLIITGISNYEILSVDKETTNSFSLWPNPAKDKVNIRYNSMDNSKVTIELIDIQGRIINSKNYDSNSNIIESSFNTNNLNKGIYIISIKQNNNTINKKLIIN